MPLELEQSYRMTFTECNISVADILNTEMTFKLCLRFDGALELVEVNENYWITDPKYNWNLQQHFNIFPCSSESLETRSDEESVDSSDSGYEHNIEKGCPDHENGKSTFFIGNLLLLRKCELQNRLYEYVECDYIDQIGQLPVKSSTILEEIIDKRSMNRIGYMIRNKVRNDAYIQAFNPIDVHFYSFDGRQNQAVVFDMIRKNRAILSGEQNNDVGAMAIPEMIYVENYSGERIDFHEKQYVKEFIAHNLKYCKEAKDFYIFNGPNVRCITCMQIAIDLVHQQSENIEEA